MIHRRLPFFVESNLSLFGSLWIYAAAELLFRKGAAMIEFRQSNPDDAAGLSRCVDAVARERRYLAAVCGFSEDETRTFIRNLVDNGGVQILALDAGAVVGWCDVSPMPFEGMRHVGRLGMGLLPAHRGQGLGKRLLRETVDRAFATGLRRIELDVFASNQTALRLYQQAGFVTEGRKRQARILDCTEEDIVIMGLLHEEWTRFVNGHLAKR